MSYLGFFVRESLRSEVQLGVQMVALWALGVLQPLLSTLDDDPAFFVAHDASRSEIIVLAVGLAFAVPLCLWLVVSSVGWVVPQIRPALRFVALHLLFTLLAVQLLGWLPHWTLVVAAATGLAGAATTAVERSEQGRRMLLLLGLAPLLFLGQFLFASPVSDVLFPDQVDAISREDLVVLEEPREEASAGDADAAPVEDPLEALQARFPSIFVLVLDEFPAASALTADGSVNGDLVPRLAEFSETAHFWRDMTTPASHTPLAVPALLTGQTPRATAAPTYSAYPQNLFTLLGGVYEASMDSDIVDMCSPSI